MRRRYKIDPVQEKLMDDIVWFVDAAYPNRKRIESPGTLMTATLVFLAREHGVPVDWGRSFPLPVVFTTGAGSTQLRYLEQMNAAQSGLPPSVMRVLQNAKTRIVTDRPTNLVYVSPDEAVRMCSWDLPITVWSPAGRATFWARQEDMSPILTLRLLHSENTE